MMELVGRISTQKMIKNPLTNYFKDRAQKHREKLGGRHELWYLDVIHSEFWFQWNSETRGRPHPLCRGTPTVEIYSPKQ